MVEIRQSEFKKLQCYSTFAEQNFSWLRVQLKRVRKTWFCLYIAERNNEWLKVELQCNTCLKKLRFPTILVHC